MLKALAYTGGRNVPSARFRIRQYIRLLAPLGIDLTESLATFVAYPPRLRLVRPLWGVAHLASRALDVVSDRDSDVVIFQREMFSSTFTLERFTRRPRILDVDDAIWLQRGGGFARRLAELSDTVICGNSFIADWFSKWNARIELLPTVVNTDRFTPSSASNDRLVIGWSGTSGGFFYFKEVIEAVAEVLREIPNAVFRVISDVRPSLPSIPHNRMEYIPWSPEVEVTSLQDIAVGLMPLDNSDWSRGKCSYKMLLYMSCGVPVVVSPVGMNSEVLQKGDLGFGATTHAEWVDAIMTLLRDEQLRRRMGQDGRRVVCERFSLSGAAPRMAQIIMQVAVKA
jgi:glycosyltransferase involved in cell wall biosynthesis